MPVRNMYYRCDITCLIVRTYILLAIYLLFSFIVNCAIMAVACLYIKLFDFVSRFDMFLFDNFNAIAFFKKAYYRACARY